jgi:hypothetical protein
MHTHGLGSHRHPGVVPCAPPPPPRMHALQDTALTSLKVSAQLCGELLSECASAPPEALLNAAIQLHDHALLVRVTGG